MARKPRGTNRTKVVDFTAFRAQRAQTARRADGPVLPLFDGEPAPADPPAVTGAQAARHLSDREVRHRERMLAFLRASADR